MGRSRKYYLKHPKDLKDLVHHHHNLKKEEKGVGNGYITEVLPVTQSFPTTMTLVGGLAQNIAS